MGTPETRSALDTRHRTRSNKTTTKHNTENYKDEKLGTPQNKGGIPRYSERVRNEFLSLKTSSVLLIVKSGKHTNRHQGDMARKSQCFSKSLYQDKNRFGGIVISVHALNSGDC